MTSWPENLISSTKSEVKGFAWFPNTFEITFDDLASVAEKEDWDYHFTQTSYRKPILFNYIKYTYKRVAEEKKIELSDDGNFSCFNTGLVTDHQEPIYASFEVNRSSEENEPWVFKGWFRRGDHRLNIFPELPEIAHYFIT